MLGNHLTQYWQICLSLVSYLMLIPAKGLYQGLPHHGWLSLVTRTLVRYQANRCELVQGPSDLDRSILSFLPISVSLKRHLDHLWSLSLKF